jgi:hypothetical protein
LIDPNVIYYKQATAFAGRKQSVQIYLPARSALVLMPL